MKVAVSIPNDVFKQAERLAKKQKRSRSKLYALALAEYLAHHARHTDEEITESWNRVIAEIGDQTDPFVEAAATEVLKNTEW